MGIAGSATIAGAILLGAAAPALAGQPTSTSANGTVHQPGGLDSCGNATQLAPIAIPGYTSGDKTVSDATTGLSATFSKSGNDTHVTWQTSSDVKVSAAFFVAGNSPSQTNLLVTYAGVSSDTIFDAGTNQITSITLCYTLDQGPSSTATPPPTTTVGSAQSDSGTWKLALIGIGGILATLAVITPRRVRRKS